MTLSSATILWCVVQVSCFLCLAAPVYLAVRRRNPRAGTLTAASSLAIVIALSTLAASPWPTGSTWQIGYTSQLRATLEKTVQRGVTLGVAAGFSNAPLTYSAARSFDPNCPGSCQAHADVTQYVAFLRAGGGGTGFHYLFNLEGGATSISNFREEITSAKLEPTAQSYDMTFGFGGGFGYGISQSGEVYIGQLTDFILHKQAEGQTSQSAPRQTTFRAGFRLGF